MAAMMCPLPLLLLLIDNGITDSPAVDIISVDSGGAIRLRSDLTEAEQKLLHDLRWKHANLLLVLKDNMTKCPNGRCTLLPDGSLSYSRTETQDSGAYSMQAFDKDGKRFKMKEILLRVDSKHSSSRVAAGSLTTGCFLLLGFTVTFFIIKRKRARLSRTTAAQENVYVEMNQSGKKEEELYCALFNNVDFRETPTPPTPTQDSPDVEDV